jgi:hypothetical protein
MVWYVWYGSDIQMRGGVRVESPESSESCDRLYKIDVFILDKQLLVTPSIP